MALTEKTETGKIEYIKNTGHVQVRTDTIIERDGVEISRTFHRHVIAPGDDYSNEPKDVQAICKAVHTTAKVKAYRDMLAAQE